MRIGPSTLFARTLLVLGSCLVGIVLFEAVLRWWFPVYDPRGRVSFHCTEGVYLGKPDTVSRQWTNTGEFDVEVVFNRYGLRDQRDIRDAGAGDIFVVGDSFSFGQGVEENERYSSLVDAESGFRFFNISIPNDLDGYLNMLRYVESNGVDVQNVVIGVTMENDIALYPKEVMKCHANGIASWSDLVANPSRISVRNVKKLLAANSAVYSLVSSLIQQNPVFRSLGLNLNLVDPNDVFPGISGYSDIVLNTSVLRLIDMASSYDALIMVIPSRGLWQGTNREVQSRIHDRFVELLAHKKLDFLDLRPAMEETGAPLAHHFPLEGHWNGKGHELAARELDRHIRENSKFR